MYDVLQRQGESSAKSERSANNQLNTWQKHQGECAPNYTSNGLNQVHTIHLREVVGSSGRHGAADRFRKGPLQLRRSRDATATPEKVHFASPSYVHLQCPHCPSDRPLRKCDRTFAMHVSCDKRSSDRQGAAYTSGPSRSDLWQNGTGRIAQRRLRPARRRVS